MIIPLILDFVFFLRLNIDFWILFPSISLQQPSPSLRISLCQYLIVPVVSPFNITKVSFFLIGQNLLAAAIILGKLAQVMSHVNTWQVVAYRYKYKIHNCCLWRVVKMVQNKCSCSLYGPRKSLYSKSTALKWGFQWFLLPQLDKIRYRQRYNFIQNNN